MTRFESFTMPTETGCWSSAFPERRARFYSADCAGIAQAPTDICEKCTCLLLISKGLVIFLAYPEIGGYVKEKIMNFGGFVLGCIETDSCKSNNYVEACSRSTDCTFSCNDR